MSIRNCVATYMETKDEEELDAFALWAFGEGFRELDHSLKFMTAWNEIHGGQLELHPDGVMGEDVPKMIELWKKPLNRVRKDEDGEWHTMIGGDEEKS